MPPESLELHPDVVRFIQDRIDTVPHMEALLLLWESGAKAWTAEQIAARLYVAPEKAGSILEDLVKRRLARSDQGDAGVYYRYDCAWDQSGGLMAQVAAVYRRHLLQVVSLIHSKASTAVRDFARAFRLKKE